LLCFVPCSIFASQAASLGLGPTKLAQIGSGLGKAIRDFKKGVSDDDPEDATREAKKEISEDLPR